LELIRSFIQKDRRERCAYLLSTPKHRKKFTDALAHFKWLDERFAHSIPANIAHTAIEIADLLRKKGAGPKAWVISEISSIDGQELPLDEVMEEIWGSQMGTFLSCIPGKLGYFEGEEMYSQRLLERP
jgi:hypothetical protein